PSDLLLFENKEKVLVRLMILKSYLIMWLYLITALGMLDTQSPISARLLHDIHKILLRGKRGTSKSLG
ncbi:hypothetical protein, partial [Bartonella sp. CL29QHWL]|uniref:hypothetical protein n=1 Tax=Bartonella sp. CL29QHWL TaxID=3243522 RepID=UPI0035CF609B